MYFRLVILLLSLAASGSLHAALFPDYLAEDEHPAVFGVRVTNSHPFVVREKIRFRLAAELAEQEGALLAVSHSVVGGTVEAHYLPVQVDRSENDREPLAWMDVQLRPGESRHYNFQNIGVSDSREARPEITDRHPSGLPRRFALSPLLATEVFDLAVVEIFEGLNRFPAERESALRQALSNPLRPTFEQVEASYGPVVSTFVYRAEASGTNTYALQVLYRLFASGLCDVEITLEPRRMQQQEGYLALAKIAPGAREGGIIRWKGETRAIQGHEASPARSGRMDGLSRDISWISLGQPESGEAGAILARFIPNLTRTDRGGAAPVNDFQINEYLVGDGDQWALLSEIARENEWPALLPRSFVLPDEGEQVELAFRVLPRAARSVEAIDEAFLTFAGYRARSLEKDNLHVRLGAAEVTFGTTYSPHRLLREQVSHWHIVAPENSAQTGDHWKHFQAEIERDLRIASAIGLDWIRIQHLDAPESRQNFLGDSEGAWMLDYLEFMAQTCRQLGLGLILELDLSPADLRLVAERLGETTALFEISQKRGTDHLHAAREAIQGVRPDAIIIAGGDAAAPLAHQRTGEGLAVDAVGQEAFVDARQRPFVMRDLALALGHHATTRGQIPATTAFNWRMIDRETEEAQAHHFFEIATHLLSQRGTALAVQSDFLASLAEAPSTRALNQNQLLRLDRTPKMQAMAYHEIIRRYSAEDHRNKVIDVRMPVVTLSPGGETTLSIAITNRGSRAIEIRTRPILPEGLTTDDEEQVITLRPRQLHTVERRIRVADDLPPGFYHLFEEIRAGETVRNAWTFASLRGQPRLDLERPLLSGVSYPDGLDRLADLPFSALRHVVVGHESSPLEWEWAQTFYQTLRSATGANVQRWTHLQLPAAERQRGLLLIGNQETNPMIAEWQSLLPVDPLQLEPGQGVVMAVRHPDEGGRFAVIISGRDQEGMDRAAADFLYRYWRFARDALSFHPERPALSDWSDQARAATGLRRAPVLTASKEKFAPGEAIRLHVSAGDAAAPGLSVAALRPGETTELGRTDRNGELTIRLAQPGDYQLTVEGGVAIAVTVE